MSFPPKLYWKLRCVIFQADMPISDFQYFSGPEKGMLLKTPYKNLFV